MMPSHSDDSFSAAGSSASRNPQRGFFTLKFPPGKVSKALSESRNSIVVASGPSRVAKTSDRLFGFSTGQTRVVKPKSRIENAHKKSSYFMKPVTGGSDSVISLTSKEHSSDSSEDEIKSKVPQLFAFYNNKFYPIEQGSHNIFSIQNPKICRRNKEQDGKLCCSGAERLYYNHYLRYINEGKVGPKPEKKHYTSRATISKIEHDSKCNFAKMTNKAYTKVAKSPIKEGIPSTSLGKPMENAENWKQKYLFQKQLNEKLSKMMPMNHSPDLTKQNVQKAPSQDDLMKKVCASKLINLIGNLKESKTLNDVNQSIIVESSNSGENIKKDENIIENSKEKSMENEVFMETDKKSITEIEKDIFAEIENESLNVDTNPDKKVILSSEVEMVVEEEKEKSAHDEDKIQPVEEKTEGNNGPQLKEPKLKKLSKKQKKGPRSNKIDKVVVSSKRRLRERKFNPVVLETRLRKRLPKINEKNN